MSIASDPPPITDPGEPTPSEFTAICHTEGCPSAEIPFDVWLYPNPEPAPKWLCTCGKCEQPITDLVQVQ